jgi:hypothetical protein
MFHNENAIAALLAPTLSVRSHASDCVDTAADDALVSWLRMTSLPDKLVDDVTASGTEVDEGTVLSAESEVTSVSDGRAIAVKMLEVSTLPKLISVGVATSDTIGIVCKRNTNEFMRVNKQLLVLTASTNLQPALQVRLCATIARSCDAIP